MTPASPLPDVALTDVPPVPGLLDWVGMQRIDLPIRLSEPGCLSSAIGQVDVQVDLPDPTIKGIHMSRLYRLLDTLGTVTAVTPYSLGRLLAQMVESHADCHSSQARVQLRFNLMCRRPALVTAGLSGWKAYPVRLRAHWHGGVVQVQARVEVGYSSTCPCSAALSRQVLAQTFAAQFAGQTTLTPDTVSTWLRAHGSAATPHSQRSVAQIDVVLDPLADALGLIALIDRAEAALGTPLQAAVKRADEQAFARLNGQHLMYVEDAARKLSRSLHGHYEAVAVFVRHAESLHPHDAVAWMGRAQA